MRSKAAPALSVLGVVERRGPEFAPLLEPGETLQVIVPARSGAGRLTESAISTLTGGVGPSLGEHYMLLATDRAWLPVRIAMTGKEQHSAQAREDRSIRPDVSSLRRFDGFSQPYSVDPMWTDHVRAANAALDALQAGQPFDLAALGDWVRSDPKKSRGILRSAFSFGR